MRLCSNNNLLNKYWLHLHIYFNPIKIQLIGRSEWVKSENDIAIGALLMDTNKQGILLLVLPAVSSFKASL